MGKKSICGAEHFLTFVDDKTHYVWVYPLKKRSSVLEKLQIWKITVEKSIEFILNTLRTDNGGQFLSS